MVWGYYTPASTAEGTDSRSVIVVFRPPDLADPEDRDSSCSGADFVLKRFAERANAALFRHFAAVEPTPEGMARFTAEFGDPLSEGEVQVIDLESGPDFTAKIAGTLPSGAAQLIDIESGQQLGTFFEPTRSSPDPRDWSEDILAMRRCIQLWDLISAGDTDRLGEHIQWGDFEDGRVVGYDSHPELLSSLEPPPPDMRTHAVIATEVTHPDLMRQLVTGDPVEPARIYIGQVVNKHITDWVLVRMLPTFPQRSGDSRGSASVRNALYMIPKNFLAGLWLQFAEAVAGNKQYERCRECLGWFEVVGGERKARKDKVYCSPRCKVGAHRKRMEEARRLHAQGKKPGEIAQALGTDVKTVRKWIGK
jgi:hypothetical protein